MVRRTLESCLSSVLILPVAGSAKPYNVAILRDLPSYLLVAIANFSGVRVLLHTAGIMTRTAQLHQYDVACSQILLKFLFPGELKESP
jgi:hypothetical protein